MDALCASKTDALLSNALSNDEIQHDCSAPWYMERGGRVGCEAISLCPAEKCVVVHLATRGQAHVRAGVTDSWKLMVFEHHSMRWFHVYRFHSVPQFPVIQHCMIIELLWSDSSTL